MAKCKHKRILFCLPAKGGGAASIETYGPYFYTNTETEFIASLNRLLFFAGSIFVLASIAISIFLSRAIVRPIVKAGDAARHIAKAYASGGAQKNLSLKIDEDYQTKELFELSRSINALAAELQEAERRQKQLTLDVAHELRTPLTCLQGNIEAMIDGVWEPTPERLASCHEEIMRPCQAC